MSMISKIEWAKRAYEQAGYTDNLISERCQVSVSTVRSWRKKSGGWVKPDTVTQKAVKAVDKAYADVDMTMKRYYPQGAVKGQRLAHLHGLKSSALFENLTPRAIDVINAVLDGGELDELDELRTSLAMSLTLITQWQNEIAILEEKAKAAAADIGLENSGILDALTVSTEKVEGTRAGKPESLKSTRTERKIVRYAEAISRLHVAISRENVNYAKTLERYGKIRNERTKLSQGTGESEQASGLVAAMDKIAENLRHRGGDVDLED